MSPHTRYAGATLAALAVACVADRAPTAVTPTADPITPSVVAASTVAASTVAASTVAAAGPTYVVTTTASLPDPDVNTTLDDHACDTSPTETSGPCSLVAAAQNHNKHGGTTSIGFALGTGTPTIPIAGSITFAGGTVLLDGGPGRVLVRIAYVYMPSPHDDSPTLRLVNTTGSTIRGLAVNGIKIIGGGANTIAGNVVGTDLTGALLDHPGGIYVERADGNEIVGNVVNGATGIVLRSSRNKVKGNTIGLSPANGTTPIAGTRGVEVQLITGTLGEANVIGGPGADGNVIVARQSGGVSVTTKGNTVEGNLIGVDRAGRVYATTGVGIWVTDENNVIRSNVVRTAGHGIEVYGDNARVEGNTVTGARAFGIHAWNVLGGLIARNTVTGTTPVTTPVSTFPGWGLAIWSSRDLVVQHNTISSNAGGGVDFYVADYPQHPGGSRLEDNLVSANGGPGVRILSGMDGQQVRRNQIVGNNGHGVEAAASSLTIEGNTLRDNVGRGVLLVGSGSTVRANTIRGAFGAGVAVHHPGSANAIRENSIAGTYPNTGSGLGIDLAVGWGREYGVTPNDAGDADGGANMLQNFPVLTSATKGFTTVVSGTLASAPSATFTIDFFANASCDASGHGEAETYLGSMPVTTNAAGSASFTAHLQTGVGGNQITATATDPQGNTSELSRCVQATGSAAPEVYGAEWQEFTLTVTGAVRGVAGTYYTIKLYHTLACDPLDPGSGATYLGEVNVATYSTAPTLFGKYFAGGPPSGFVTATATDAGGRVSAFSACRPIPESYTSRTMDLQPNVVSLSGTLTVTAVLLSSYTESGGTSYGFDARQVHPALVWLAVQTSPTSAASWVPVAQRGGAYSTFQRDVDGDGDLDVGYNFSVADLKAAGLTTGRIMTLVVRHWIFDGAYFAWHPIWGAQDPSPPTIVP